MKYIVIDLEWNGSGTSEGYFDEIIEIGAVSLDDEMKITGEFQSFVNPRQTKKLRGRIKELTHITNEDLKKADGFVTVFRRFKEWIGAEDDNCMLSWGNADILVLYKNLERYGMLSDIYIIRNYCDAQLLCQKAVDVSLSKQVGLSAFAEEYDIEIVEEQLHRAINDSRLTARCLAKLFTPELFSCFVKKADRVFYDRMNFKSYNITDINDEQIDFSAFMTRCPGCGAYMKRMTRLSCRNKKHYARYRCGLCGTQYNISHLFKVTYDGLEHRLNLTRIGSPEEADGSGGSEEPQNNE